MLQWVVILDKGTAGDIWIVEFPDNLTGYKCLMKTVAKRPILA